MKSLLEFLNRINAGIIVTDKAGHIIEFNNMAEQLIGKDLVYPSNNGTNESLRKLSLPEYVHSGSQQNKWKLKLNIKNKIYWFNVSSFPLNDMEGEMVKVLNFLNDVPESTLHQESLTETTRNIESVLYSVSSDLKQIYFITEAVYKLFGYTPREIIEDPKKFLRQVLPKDFTNYKKFIRELKSGKPAVVEYQIEDNYGVKHYVRNSGFPVIENGEIIKIDGVVNDITKEKKFQLELEKSEEKFRFLIETANDLIFTLDSYGYFIDVNTYGALSLSYQPEEMKGKHFLEFINEENKADIAMAFQKILKLDKVISFESVFKDKYNKNVIFEIQGRPTKTNDSITGMLGIGRDITQRLADEKRLKELNTRLIEANRIISIERDRAQQQISVLEEVNKLKSEFIGNISHELRTPLASIVGFSETISLDPEMPIEMIMEFNNIILSEGKRLAKLINDLLDFAKMEGGKIEIFRSEFNVVELINNVIAQHRKSAEEKGLIFSSEIPDKEIILLADKERIAQVYGNIISNAIKFTESGGRIKIITNEYQKEFDVIISDTGIGIPERELQNIFRKFFKTDAQSFQQGSGIGIGLGLVKQIVDLHKGLISVKSEVNKGTTFIVKLPKAKTSGRGKNWKN